MRSKRKDLLRFFLFVVFLCLLVVLALYFKLHQEVTVEKWPPKPSPQIAREERPPRHPHTPSKSRKQLSMAVVVHALGVRLASQVDEPSRLDGYLSQGTLLLLDASNALAVGDKIAVEVLFPLPSWLVVAPSDLSDLVQFVSLSAAQQHANLADYVSECNTNSSWFCSNEQHTQKHELLKVLSSQYHPVSELDLFSFSSSFRFDTSLSDSDGADWTQQLPIGNGRIGALVGGTVDHEVIPLSIANLFAFHRAAGRPADQPGADQTMEGSTGPIPGAFAAARQELLLGNIQNATHLLSGLQHGGQGGFQGAADLLLVFDRHPIPGKPPDAVPPSPLLQVKGKPRPVFRPRQPVNQQFFVPGRKGLVDRIRHSAGLAAAAAHASTEELLLSKGSLDMRAGLAFEQSLQTQDINITDVLANALPASLVHWHHREWFINGQSDVLVGRLACQALLHAQGSVLVNTTAPCLHFSMRLQRDVSHESATVELSSQQAVPSALQAGLLPGAAVAFSADLSAHSSAQTAIPAYHICMTVLCASDSSGTYSLHDHLLTCSSAHSAVVLLTIAMTSPLGQPPSSFSATDPSLKAACLAKLHNVTALGYERLRAEHVQRFSERMSRVQVDLRHECQEDCSEAIGGAQLAQLVNDSTFSSLSPVLLQYSRYLLYSSATSSVPNLQGLWADGLSSAWNGDYHLNINLQMALWPAGALAVNEALPPLLDFLEYLAAAGHVTAQEVYGLQGWVAHGFTDSSLDGGLLGDLQWSLCVTCGAWLAAQAFDLSLYQAFDEDQAQRLLDILRGVMVFFQSYLFIGKEGVYHTGPTTSPENSFMIGKPPSAIPCAAAGADAVLVDGKAVYLAFTPAIDLSILRQAVNAFRLLAHWLDSSSDILLAQQMVAIVAQLPHSALPSLQDDGQVDEYPDALQQHTPIDPGHRHWSLLHWLYPNPFLPHTSNSSQAARSALQVAAAQSLLQKARHGGGHTSWSAAWEACLHATLGHPAASIRTLKRLYGKYLTPNLLSLHPPLQPLDGILECYTCYQEQPAWATRAAQTTAKAAVMKRGFSTEDNVVFQLDGNMGLSAALVQLLVQSPVPGVISLLPALTASGMKEGFVAGMVLRGGIVLSMRWTSSQITYVRLVVHSMHQRWLAVEEDVSKPGFYLPSTSNSAKLMLMLHSPTALKPLDRSLHWEELSETAPSWGTGEGSIFTYRLFVSQRQAGDVLLCGKTVRIEACRIAATADEASAHGMVIRAV